MPNVALTRYVVVALAQIDPCFLMWSPTPATFQRLGGLFRSHLLWLFGGQHDHRLLTAARRELHELGEHGDSMIRDSLRAQIHDFAISKHGVGTARESGS